MKVLLVDDTAENLEFGKKGIEKFFPNVQVETCDSFNEAMKLIVPNNGYDAVLTDLNMPVNTDSAWYQKMPGFNDKEIIPYGLIIAMRAALIGVKNIAIVTNGGHHSSAINAAIEYLGMGNGNDRMYDNYRVDMGMEVSKTKPNFNINGANVLIVDTFKNSENEEAPYYGFDGALSVLMKHK